jgi:hypothetical protein
MASKKSTMNMMADALAPAKADKKVATAPAAEAQTIGAGDVGQVPAGVAETPAASAPATPTAPTKEPKGPVKIETNQQLLKALWSSRGNVYIKVDSFPVPLAVVKKEMTEYLKTQADANGPAPYDLVPRANETASDLVIRPEYAESLKTKEDASA